jgi:outer membrane biosynthesis protein TonB
VTIIGSPERLVSAVARLRDQVSATVLPLEVAGVDAARRARRDIAGQLDDYVLPRLRRLDAPLLTVVGGSTGAGKSTLVNSLVRQEVSAPGVLRPTTRSPVLVCHPDDVRWFADQRILPRLSRTSGGSTDHRTLHLVESKNTNAGLALLDAPDIDSVVRENRELAAQLLAAADLWLFVTTAARYADAVPWDLLRTAQQRSTALAVVLDRVPPGAEDEVTKHLAAMLAEHSLGESPLFVVGETELQDGLLPAEAIAPVRSWLDGLAADAEKRNAVVRRTLDGALDSLSTRVPELVVAGRAQQQADEALRRELGVAYEDAGSSVDEAMSDGSLLRGEVLARWQEFVGTGEILRSLEAQIGRIRDRLSATVRGRPQPGSDLRVALESSVESLVRSAADRAAERTAEAWRANPAGAALIAKAKSDLTRASAELAANAEVAVREWQGYVLELVRSQGADKRSTARFLSYGVNGSGLLVMLVVFAHTGGLTGAEVGVAGGTSVLSQKILEAVFGDQAVRQLAADARADLRRRVEGLLGEEEARYIELLAAQDVDLEAPTRLEESLAAVQQARADFTAEEKKRSKEGKQEPGQQDKDGKQQAEAKPADKPVTMSVQTPPQEPAKAPKATKAAEPVAAEPTPAEPVATESPTAEPAGDGPEGEQA